MNIYLRQSRGDMCKKILRERGFVALISILIIGAISFFIASGLSSRSLDTSDASFADESSLRALYLSESCVEHAFLRLLDDPLYQGNETFFIENDSCYVGAVDVVATGTVSFITESTIARFARHVQVSAIVTDSQVEVLYWRDVP